MNINRTTEALYADHLKLFAFPLLHAQLVMTKICNTNASQLFDKLQLSAKNVLLCSFSKPVFAAYVIYLVEKIFIH